MLKKTVFFLALLLPVLAAPVLAGPKVLTVTNPRLVINLPSRTLDVYSGNSLVKEYPVAVGKPSSPTPLGDFSILSKEVNPWWYPPWGGNSIPSGPDNPLGYRWMSFLPLYGIHGTNAPWEIGMTASHGCVRMKEEDAEELFAVVNCGTPVKVTYDRIKLCKEENGTVSLGIYPDIYGRGDISLADLKEVLAESGYNNLVDDKFLLNLIKTQPDKQTVLGQFAGLKINGKLQTERVLVQNGIIYVPVWTVAGALSTSIQWDQSTSRVCSKGRVVPAMIKGDIIYVTLADSKLLFGGEQIWQEEDHALSIYRLAVFLNGKVIEPDVQVIDGILAVQVLPLANALEQNVVWNQGERFLRGTEGNKIPIDLLNGEPYIKITRINEAFNTFVYWNEPMRRIELTYPAGA
ncbi:Hypothetical protein LUCI_4028 [Lucifera butyrica]|uniref:L,D-TPase catalytic domain-containing protein n=1 Tax=Lucifera butyrica TaxID=1351585 RepID=A0A498RBX8_9FIRM|nr:L,D-transpeptidase family protein [Lucifera butyrica]VBB08749.1 Hypothetical protein LUCI_4028 [Lucifera butyrica]